MQLWQQRTSNRNSNSTVVLIVVKSIQMYPIIGYCLKISGKVRNHVLNDLFSVFTVLIGNSAKLPICPFFFPFDQKCV